MRPSSLFLPCFALLLVTLCLPAAAFCPGGAPLLLDPASGAVQSSVPFTGAFTVEGNGSPLLLGASPLDPVVSFSYADGRFTFTPGEVSPIRILFFAVNEDGCVDTRVGVYEAELPPRIERPEPLATEVTLLESRSLPFSAVTAPENRVTWLLDGKEVARDVAAFLYQPGFNDAGVHNLSFIATDPRGLASEQVWTVTVQNKNRVPVQLTEFLGVELPLGGELILNLSHYFLDPDRTTLRFDATYEQATGSVDAVSAVIAGEMVTLTGRAYGKSFIRFTATDPLGASVTSDAVAFSAANATIVRSTISFCGDGVCFAGESCSSCPEDCGDCEEEACTPQWDCAAWGDCSFPGYQRRVCRVVNGCEEPGERPPEMRTCDYRATCDDAVMNGEETGVDCGGPCDPCPSCDDGLLNQGEEGEDCGGPCDPCPSCDDGLLNQDESDIDCGGPCAQCAAGARCFVPADCASYRCVAGFCSDANCSDGIRNQGEERTDCGGPCAACPSCDDGLLNQGEEGVDCGGPCAVCPTCDDGLRNQEERLVDCGGPCRGCGWRDYLPGVLRVLFWVAFVLIAVFIGYLVRVIFTSRMLFLFSHGKAIHFFYEDAPTYALVRGWNAVRKRFRFDRRRAEQATVEQAMQDLAALRSAASAGRVRPQMTARLRSLYASLLGLPASFEFAQLLEKMRESGYPFCLRVIILRNTKLLALLELSRLYTDDAFALQEVLEALDELRKAF